MTALLMPMVGPAQAAEPSRPQEARARTFASFEGRKIDLAGDWGGARACLVWRQGGVVECFRSDAALDAREAQLAPRRAASTATAPTVTAPTGTSTGTSATGTAAATGYAAYSYSCSSSFRLYEHNWYGGRRLSFWDRGFWQNLSDYGFEDRTSSYIVGACYVWLAEHADGGGAWYNGPTYPYAGEPAMPWYWQDTISSIYVG